MLGGCAALLSVLVLRKIIGGVFMSLLLHAGLDIGSTTAKAVVLDNEDRILFSRYIRHFADIQGTARRILSEIRENYFG